MALDPKLQYLFEKGYTLDSIKQSAQKGINPEHLYYFEKGYSPNDVKIEESKLTEGFGKKIIRSIAEPVATLLSRPVQLGKAISGSTPEQQGVSLPFLGRIETSQSGKDVVKDIGRAAETISLGLGGGGAAQTVKQGLGGMIKQGVITGIKTQTPAGALMGFGEGLQQAADEEPSKAFKTIFTNTALGAGTGLVGGTVFGAATPVFAKGVTGVRKFANIQGLEQKISDTYKRTLNPTTKEVQRDTRFGGDSFKFLSKEAPDLPISVDKDGRVVLDDAIEMARQKYQAEATAYKPIIRNSGKYLDIDDVVANAKAQAKKEFDGSDLIKAEKQIDDEVNAYIANSPDSIVQGSGGKRLISLDRADDIKTYSWSRGKGWGSPDAEVWNDTNNLIGHAFKDSIEKELPDAPIKAMNRRLGQWKNAIDMMERRNGKVSGSGGKLSKYILRATGAGIGASSGDSLPGKATGALTGGITANALALLMANPNVKLMVIRQLLKRLQKEGQTNMIKEAQDILQEQASKYLLPAAGQSSYRGTSISPSAIPVYPKGYKGIIENVGTKPII
jgi:hypothetical protein